MPVTKAAFDQISKGLAALLANPNVRGAPVKLIIGCGGLVLLALACHGKWFTDRVVMAYLLCMDLVLLHIMQTHSQDGTMLVLLFAVGNATVVRSFFSLFQEERKGAASDDDWETNIEAGEEFEDVGESGSLLCARARPPRSRMRSIPTSIQKPKERPKVKPPLRFQAKSVYQDFNRPIMRVILTFLGQLALAWLYLLSLQESHEKWLGAEMKLGPGEHTNSYAYWTVGVLGVQIGVLLSTNTSGNFGNTFEGVQWWRTVFVSERCLKEDFHEVTLSPTGKYVRFVMSFLANSLLRDLILFTVPIFLMQASSPLDVVMNAVGATFLTTIDDISDGRHYVLVSFGTAGGPSCTSAPSLEMVPSRMVSLPVPMEKRKTRELRIDQNGTVVEGQTSETYDEAIMSLLRRIEELENRDKKKFWGC